MAILSATRFSFRRGRNSTRTLKPIPEEHSTSFSVVSEENARDSWAAYLLINAEREDNLLPPLNRSEKLHNLARFHADRMAASGFVRHSVKDVATLKKLLRSSKVGENVQRGPNICDIHVHTMEKLPSRSTRTSIRIQIFSCSP